MFNKLLSSIGIGGTKVDTILDNETLQAGEAVTGRVFIKGGNADQEIKRLMIYTMAQLGEDTFTVCETHIADNVRVRAKDELEIDFEYVLPPDTPPTFEYCQHWLHTDADMKRASDSSDRDYIEVLPHSAAQNIFEALHELGFELEKIGLEEAHPQMQSYLPLVQELEFIPRSGIFAGRVDEVEVILLPREEYIDVFMEVDRKAGMFNEWMDNDERKVHFQLGDEVFNRPQLLDMLQNTIAEYAQR